MDSIKHNKECAKPDIGRGCKFCNCSSECEATPCEGCFKLHENAWLEEYPENTPTDIFEIRFKNTRRSYYQNANALPLKRGDIVAVEATPGHDIGIVSLTGDMVAKQMRRTGFNPFNGEFKKIYRKAKPYDIEKWQEAIALEQETMILARQIAADMGLNMKIGDVEYQGDKIKAIFYYIADERVDFRELIKVFAEKFHIRIEMKQIGARQEAGRIGGLGACGRELCCASWIASFTSVTTNAARMQEVSLNPQKLAGQCSKLKCCMMYEYDTYADARKDFPRVREPLQAMEGEYHLVKSDILAHTMMFSSSKDALVNVVILPVERVKEIIALNRAGKKVDKLQNEEVATKAVEEPTYRSEEDSITRFDSSKRRNNKSRNRGNRGNNENRNGGGNGNGGNRNNNGSNRNSEGNRGNGGENKSSQPQQPRGEQRADQPRQPRQPQRPSAPKANDQSEKPAVEGNNAAAGNGGNNGNRQRRSNNSRRRNPNRSSAPRENGGNGGNNGAKSEGGSSGNGGNNNGGDKQ